MGQKVSKSRFQVAYLDLFRTKKKAQKSLKKNFVWKHFGKTINDVFLILKSKSNEKYNFVSIVQKSFYSYNTFVWRKLSDEVR